MVLGNLPVLGRLTNLDDSRTRASCTCSRCGWVLFGHFLFSRQSFLFSFSLSLGDGLILTVILYQWAVKQKKKTSSQPTITVWYLNTLCQAIQSNRAIERMVQSDPECMHQVEFFSENKIMLNIKSGYYFLMYLNEIYLCAIEDSRRLLCVLPFYDQWTCLN